MNAPCGHEEATCVIGNFWTCKVCEARDEISDRLYTPRTMPTFDHAGGGNDAIYREAEQYRKHQESYLALWRALLPQSRVKELVERQRLIDLLNADLAAGRIKIK